jgi:hypothetical protein
MILDSETIKSFFARSKVEFKYIIVCKPRQYIEKNEKEELKTYINDVLD